MRPFYHLLRDALRQEQRPNDVYLKLIPHVARGNVNDGTSLKNAGIVDQDVDVPRKRFPAITLNCDIEFLYLYLQPTRRDITLKRLNLPVYLNGSDHLEALLCKLHGHSVSKAGSRACNQNLLHISLSIAFVVARACSSGRSIMIFSRWLKSLWQAV